MTLRDARLHTQIDKKGIQSHIKEAEEGRKQASFLRAAGLKRQRSDQCCQLDSVSRPLVHVDAHSPLMLSSASIALSQKFENKQIPMWEKSRKGMEFKKY